MALFRLLLLPGFAMMLWACATKPNPPRDPLKPVSETFVSYKVAVLDEMELKFPDGHTEVISVSQDGTLATPGGPVQVLGLESGVAETRARHAYPDAVSVKLREFRPNRITVLGEVFHQIHTDLGEGPMRVMDAIASANGFTSLANKRRVRLLREDAGHSEVYELDLREMMLGRDLNQNFLLQPGDVITVPRNFL